MAVATPLRSRRSALGVLREGLFGGNSGRLDRFVLDPGGLRISMDAVARTVARSPQLAGRPMENPRNFIDMPAGSARSLAFCAR